MYTKKCIVLDVITITKVKSRYYFCSLQKKGNNIIHLFLDKETRAKKCLVFDRNLFRPWHLSIITFFVNPQ